MRKIIITITAFLFSLLTFSQDSGKILQADFRGKQCNGGSGFCGTTGDTINKNRTSNMKNFNAIKISSSAMILELNTDQLSKEDQVRFFGKEYAKITATEKLTFIQEDDYEFSFDVLLYLDMDVRYKYLKKGEYPVEIVRDTIRVTLTLAKD